MAVSRVPIGHNIGSRDGTLNKDSKVGNAIIEIEKKESSAIVKRPGLIPLQPYRKQVSISRCNVPAM